MMADPRKFTATPSYACGSRPWVEDEIGLLRALSGHSRKAEAHQTLVYENDAISEVFLIHKGWSFAYRLLPNGSRQIINFPLPGDIVGSSDTASGRASASLECLSDVIYSPIPIAAIREAMTSDMRVGKAFLWMINRTNSITIEHLVNAGRRSALARTAHLVLEFATRLSNINVPIEQGFELPFSQTLLADALGLTPIHVNRIFRQLREDNLVTFKAGVIRIHDRKNLEKVASFTPDYLISD